MLIKELLLEGKYNLGLPTLGNDSELIKYMRLKLANFPEYVFNDWIKEIPANKNEFNQFLEKASKKYGPLDKIIWTKEPQILNFKFDMFDNKTKERILAKKGGQVNPLNLPKDEIRHKTQLNLIKGKNPKTDIVIREPVILFKHGKKYELIEGWHRTVQALKLYPNGYRGYAYIGKRGK